MMGFRLDSADHLVQVCGFGYVGLDLQLDMHVFMCVFMCGCMCLSAFAPYQTSHRLCVV